MIHYEGSSVPAGFAADWTDATGTALDVSANSYPSKYKNNKAANVGGTVTDLPDEHGRPINFILGCTKDETHTGDEYDRPLVIQYDLVTKENGAEKERVTKFEALPLTNTTDNPYDACGRIASPSYSRLFGYKLGPNQEIDVNSVIFHNIMKASETSEIDTSKTYFAKPTSIAEKQDINELVHFKASVNSTFAGYSNFSITMDKNLSITSAKYPEPHSLYLDVKPDMYEQNITKIKSGVTKIRYSLYNLYNSSYHIQYESKGQLKDVVLPIKTVVSYQVLEQDKGNKGSMLLKDSAIAPDFSADKIRTLELVNVTIQMDLLTKSESGSTSILGKSAISYKFAYITAFENKKVSVFNWNLFLTFFFIGYVVVYAAAAFGVYKFMK